MRHTFSEEVISGGIAPGHGLGHPYFAGQGRDATPSERVDDMVALPIDIRIYVMDGHGDPPPESDAGVERGGRYPDLLSVTRELGEPPPGVVPATGGLGAVSLVEGHIVELAVQENRRNRSPGIRPVEKTTSPRP